MNIQETILKVIILEQDRVLRTKDIMDMTGYKRERCKRGLQNLKNRKLITWEYEQGKFCKMVTKIRTLKGIEESNRYKKVYARIFGENG